MEVIGLDLSLTSTGVATSLGTFAIKSKLKAQPRLIEIRDAIKASVLSWDEPYVVIEGYSFGQRVSHSHAAGGLGEVVRVALFEEGVPFVDIPPTSLKKFITGRGNAAKVEVSSMISARTGVVFQTDDEADAWALREMGLQHFGLNKIEWPKKNLEALDKVDWI